MEYPDTFPHCIAQLIWRFALTLEYKTANSILTKLGIISAWLLFL